MKKTLSNAELRYYLNIMSRPDFFVNAGCKLPAAFRHAYRVNRTILNERFKLYQEEHMDLLKALEKEGNAEKIETDKWQLTPEGSKEVNDLAAATNDLDLEAVDNDVLTFIRNYDLSMAEDEFLDLFEGEGE